MFSLLFGFWKFLFRKDDFFVLILGLDNAGKSTFLEQTKVKFNKDYRPINLSRITTTVGLNVGKIVSKGIAVNFWDLGGQRELQLLWDKYFLESHAVIYVIDSSDIDRIEESKEAFEKVIQNEMLAGLPLLLVANKQDIPGSLKLERIKEIFRSSVQFIGKRDCHTVAASAIRGEGIMESIDWLVNCIKRNSLNRPPKTEDG